MTSDPQSNKVVSSAGTEATPPVVVKKKQPYPFWLGGGIAYPS